MKTIPTNSPTKEQISFVIGKSLEQKNGLQELLKVFFEQLMCYERREFLTREQLCDGESASQIVSRNKANGYRLRHYVNAYGELELRIPRDRLGYFQPYLMAVLRDQEEEALRLALALYSKGLSQHETSDVLEEFYGGHYSKSSISRMTASLNEEVNSWLSRPLDTYYPIVYIDGIHVKVRNENGTVNADAFYVVLGVREDQTREVLSISRMAEESATGWKLMLESLKQRGVNRIGLLVADGLRGLETRVAEVYQGLPLQRCTTHLKRDMLARVRSDEKAELAADLRQVFMTGVENYTIDDALLRWQQLCRKWGRYTSIKRMGEDESYRYYMTYLAYHPAIQSMIYTTNWIERLQRTFRRVLRFRTALPNEQSALTLMGKTAMDLKCYQRKIPNINLDRSLFVSGTCPTDKQTK